MTNISWKPGNGFWIVASNWSTNTVPTSSDTATIGGASIVDFSSGIAAHIIDVETTSGGLLELSGGTMTTNSLVVGSTGYVSLPNTNSIDSIQLNGGELDFGDGGLGAASISDYGGLFEAFQTTTVANLISVADSASASIAARGGVTLTLSGTFIPPGQSSGKLTFGDPDEYGTIVYDATTTLRANTGPVIVEKGARLVAGAAGLGAILAAANYTQVKSGGTLDVNGFDTSIPDLFGDGRVTNSSSSQAALTLGVTSTSGTIDGNLSVDIGGGHSQSSSLLNYTGNTTIEDRTTFTNLGTFDLPGDYGISGPSTSVVDNQGVLAKLAGTGRSVVSIGVLNEGLIVAKHGSIDFTLGMSNSAGARVHGRVFTSGNSTYVAADTRHDFDDTGSADILFRNGAGITYLWSMNDATVTSGATTSTQVGNNWQIKGVGDFNGDGTSDLLFVYNNASNSADSLNGISYITMQNGPAATSGSGVVQQLGSVWQVAGVGDFDGDGDSDVLYRNSATGQTYIDIMNGHSINTSASGFTSSQVPDARWQIAAVGDFEGYRGDDIIWRYDNTANASDPLNGALFEWQMNGTRVVSSGLLSQQPGSDHWTVAGSGDFDGDGTTDLLLRYENAANASDPLNGFIYMDRLYGIAVTGAPTQWQVDNSWSIASIGDFNHDGKSDILFQHAGDGATYVWDMNGTATTSGNFTSMQSGPGWTVQNGVLDG